jgi:hypothetical protein
MKGVRRRIRARDFDGHTSKPIDAELLRGAHGRDALWTRTT